MERSKKTLLAAVMAVSLFSLSAMPAYADEEEVGDASIMFDLLVLRPLGLVSIVGGTAFFVGSLPIAIGTWSLGRSFNAFVKRPVVYTFVRDLGEPRP